MTPRTMTAEYEALMRENHSAPDALFAELDAERAAHQETQAKLDSSKKLYELTLSNEIRWMNKHTEAQAISRELLAALEAVCAGCHGGSWNQVHAAIAKARGVLPENDNLAAHEPTPEANV